MKSMTALLVVLLSFSGSASALADNSGAADPGDTLSFWTEPLPLALLQGEYFYIPVGADIAGASGIDAVVQLTVTKGPWYECDTESVGGWLELGTAIRPDASSGFFFAPEILLRYFKTTGGRAREQDTDGGWNFFSSDKCSGTDVANLTGSDGELHVGFDSGYVAVRAPVYFAVAVGLNIGPCFHCVPGQFFWGDLDSAPFGDIETARTNHVTFGVNLSIIRLGVGF